MKLRGEEAMAMPRVGSILKAWCTHQAQLETSIPAVGMAPSARQVKMRSCLAFAMDKKEAAEVAAMCK